MLHMTPSILYLYPSLMLPEGEGENASKLKKQQNTALQPGSELHNSYE